MPSLLIKLICSSPVAQCSGIQNNLARDTGGIAGKECSEFNMEDSEYADDTGLEFCSRGDVAEYAPKVNQHFRDWGMEVHEKKPGDTKIKTMVLMCSAPPSEYDDPETMDCADLSDIVLPNGNVIPVVHKARYLGSIMSRDCKDDEDVDHRVRSASRAFGKLSSCIFRSKQIDLAAKREVYVACVLSTLLYGSECWCLTTSLWDPAPNTCRSCSEINLG